MERTNPSLDQRLFSTGANGAMQQILAFPIAQINTDRSEILR